MNIGVASSYSHLITINNTTFLTVVPLNRMGGGGPGGGGGGTIKLTCMVLMPPKWLQCF